MSLPEKRRRIRSLVRERLAEDAVEAYYAFHHADNRTQLILHPPEGGQARGYLAISRTGIDVFRPLLTMRLPAKAEEAAELVYGALAPGSGVFISAPEAYGPLLRAFFSVQTERLFRLLELPAHAFEPVVNVLVTRATSPDGHPRYEIRPSSAEAGEVGAWAGLNWLSPDFAEVAVGTRSQYRQRGWGRSVVSALCQELLSSGRTPLYLVSDDNRASWSLARSLGFRDTGARRLLLEGSLRKRVD